MKVHARAVVGVDGGGSRTRAGVFDMRLTPMGRAEGPASAIHPAHPEASAAVVSSAVRAAVEEAGVEFPLAALHVGLAGAGRPGPRDEVREILLREGFATILTLGSDAEIAFQDVFSTGPGILVLAGTGSMVLGRGREGGVERVGGWGPLLGDEGSGYDIGRNALRLIARSEDGREPKTDLRAIVLSKTGLTRATDLAAWAVTAGRPQVAALAEAVALADEVGDPAAAAILDEAAAELVLQVELLVDRLGPWDGAIPMALVGGLLGPGRPLRSRIEGALERWGPGLREQIVDPVRGAGRLALESVLQG